MEKQLEKHGQSVYMFLMVFIRHGWLEMLEMVEKNCVFLILEAAMFFSHRFFAVGQSKHVQHWDPTFEFQSGHI